MSDITIPGAYRPIILDGIQNIDRRLNHIVLQLQQALGADTSPPKNLVDLRQLLSSLNSALGTGGRVGGDIVIADRLGPVAKMVLMHERRDIAARIDSYRRNTQSPELLGNLAEQIMPFTAIADADWFRETESIRMPLEEDYLSAAFLSKKRPPATEEQVEFDPKHGVVLSVSQLWADLPKIRDSCASRRIGLSILFMDIDDFKRLNSRYGEPAVDREVLPLFMRLLEASFFGHGKVYRYGGDEFVAVLPNAPRPFLVPLIETLRNTLSGAQYSGVSERPQLSIGVCEVQPDHPWTEDEIVAQASAAKRFAKDEGKNATAGALYDQHEWTYVVWDNDPAA
jgi:diguanylate cyclase (GGDEF)-like protein